MDIKAVFFDLDGTLFNSARSVSASTRRAIMELHRNNILVGVATGRGPSFCLPLMEELNLDFVVAYNGQYVFTPKEIIYAEPLDKKVLRHIVRYARENHREISLGAATGVSGSTLLKFGETRLASFISDILPTGTSDLTRNSFKHVFSRILPQANYIKLLREPIYQVMMVATKSETETLEKEFSEMKITRSNSYAIDLIPKDSGKLASIQKLGEAFDFSIDQVMCFGDSQNDMAMLQGAGTGVAMGNASDEVKGIADYITTSNNQDGIARALSHFGLINFSSTTNLVSKDPNFNKVKEFHKLMDGKTQEIPHAFRVDLSSNRADFIIEELVEFLYASANGQEDTFEEMIAQLHTSIETAKDKIIHTSTPSPDILTGQVAALMDLLHLTYGSLVLAGVDPYEMFDLVHKANMAKVFPDGQPHYDSVTGKLLKPADWEEKHEPKQAISRELDRQKRIALRKSKNPDK